MMKTLLLKSLSCFLLLFVASAFAEPKNLPRFATIKSDEVNARVGPGLPYPVSFVFIKKNEPVEIIAEFNDWRQIKDFDQENSWVHVSLISKKRFVIISSALPTSLYKKPFNNSKVTANVFPKVRCEFLDYCNTKWCKVRCSGEKGWIGRKDLWGVHTNEFQSNNAFMLYWKSIF
jgi:SH3-like domain-containing protein